VKKCASAISRGAPPLSAPAMAAVSDFLDEVVLGASSADGPVQAWDVRTGMQLKAYKCVPARRRSPVPTGTRFDSARRTRRERPARSMD